MANIEVAYELKDVCKHIIAYPTEVMAYGFPYHISGRFLINGIDYESICESFYRFYVNYEKPCGTISTINCLALDSLARFMKKVNLSFDTTISVDASSLQRMDGYDPTVFVDFEDYVYHLTDNAQWLSEFDHLMTIVIPYKRNTPTYYSTMGGQIPIGKYSGITTSEPSAMYCAASCQFVIPPIPKIGKSEHCLICATHLNPIGFTISPDQPPYVE